MEQNTVNPHEHPILQFIALVCSGVFYFASIITTEAFREWTFWGLSIILLVFNITIAFPKFKDQLKKLFKK